MQEQIKRMSIILFGIVFFQIIISGCNDPIMESNALEAEIVEDQELKSQVASEKLLHPRLLFTDSALHVLKSQAVADITLQRYVSAVISNADKYLSRPLLTYTLPDGVRMLAISRECKVQMQLLGFAYRWTGDEKYAIAAKRQLLAVSSFPDWHPAHFLDVAEMTYAVSLGYDWLYQWLDQASRTTIQNAIYNYGILEYLDLYRVGNPNRWIVYYNGNQNAVINGSAIAGAVVIGDLYPEKSKEVIQKAVESIALAIKSYAPAGVWPEGNDYWAYTTDYVATGIQAMRSALGTDFGLSEIYGISETGSQIVYDTAPSGFRMHYADDWDGYRGDTPKYQMFWLGKMFNNQNLINAEHLNLEKNIAAIDPRHLIYYSPKTQSSLTLSLDRFFEGSVQLAYFRSGWSDPNALWLGTKGGFNKATHGHLDLGNFEMEALGVRWAYDLGMENYNVSGTIYSIYRKNSHSHNVPMINNIDQLESGVVKVLDHKENINEPYILYDLTTAYSNYANKLTREYKLVNNRKEVQITDVHNLKAQSDIYWGMTTPATIQILPNGEALLTKNGKSLTAKIIAPAGLNFYVESCYQAPPQNPNTGYSRLMVKSNRPAGNTTLIIKLSPNY